MLSILNNTASMQAQSALTTTDNNLGTSLQRLSTGLQINSGADGPAAYVISQAQQAQVAGLNQAIQNTNQAVNLVQTGSGALNEINNLLTQVRGLALDSANAGVNDSQAQAANQAQISNALDTINTIATSTQFNGQTLLNGSAGYNAVSSSNLVSSLSATSATEVSNFQLAVTQAGQAGEVTAASAGATTGATGNLSNTENLAQAETLTITNEGGTGGSDPTGTNTNIYLTQGMTNNQVVSAINAFASQTGVTASLDTNGQLALTSNQLGGNFSVISDQATGTAGSTGIGTTAINTTAAATGVAQIGQNIQGTLTDAGGNTFTFGQVGDTSSVSDNNVSFTSGTLEGLSFSLATTAAGTATQPDANFTGSTITTSNGSLQFQIGANSGQTASLSIANMQTSALGTGVAGNEFSNLSQINVTSAQGATDSIAVIDQAISQVSNLAAQLGAFQTNTLQANATNLQTALTNTQSSEATITDTNYASQISQYTQLQTQMQAGSSVLTNANQSNQYITQMLQQM